jgi:hypothetical protein
MQKVSEFATAQTEHGLACHPPRFPASLPSSFLLQLRLTWRN